MKRLSLPVDKMEQMLGSYAPSTNVLTKDFPEEESPSGMLARTGSYNALHGDRSLAGLEGGFLGGREAAVGRIEGRVRGEESDR